MLVVVDPAAAHDLERTLISLSFQQDGSFVLDVANDPNWLLLRLESFAGGQVPAGLTDDARDARLRALAPVFIDRIVLFVDGHEVRPTSAEYLPPTPAPGPLPALATYRLRGTMATNARTLRWLYGLVIDPYPLTITRADGRSHTEWIAGSDWSGTIDLSGQFREPTRLEIVGDYLALGYTHILPKGLDHILFVLGLFLLNTRLRPILLQVTTFTLAHSLTLGMTMYGIVSLPPRIVEPLIALSIAYVAIENLVSQQLRPWRLALVFLFGLLHGMGFAGVLSGLGLAARRVPDGAALVQSGRRGRSADDHRRRRARRRVVTRQALVPPARRHSRVARDCGGGRLLDDRASVDGQQRARPG